ncbi:GNAT family N-acetyltransferase [Saccharomonospora saliphila]|uniref:GNAT family N-acetyltransferase n=1 Tax=Saccharomonospora saliphila TaxID=369829 RepID=UPI0003629A17|nr:GNAT family N-acetyltransferase [Saccharomonospora saliphila]
MNTATTRVLGENNHRTAEDLFRAALHLAPVTDDQWQYARAGFQPGRTLGAVDDDAPGAPLVGTARSLDARLAVPGGNTVPLAAVTGVGVRADRTRRGVLTDLMRTQLADFADRGITAATLHATEGAIYGRFGYGVATRARTCTVARHTARLRPEVPVGGEVELLDLDTAVRRLPVVYAALPARPGGMTRPEQWWASWSAWARQATEPMSAVLHHGHDGPDGFALYQVGRDSGGQGVLTVVDLHAACASAFAGLWRYLLGVDLVHEIHTRGRPLDEPLELLFTDPRACRVTAVRDETWLRLVDVPAALRARPWRGPEPIVLEVHDPLLPANSGRYLLSADGAERTDDPADARLDVDALSMLWLGGWRPSALARAGRLAAAAPEAVDALVAAGAEPWCGTFF